MTSAWRGNGADASANSHILELPKLPDPHMRIRTATASLTD